MRTMVPRIGGALAALVVLGAAPCLGIRSEEIPTVPAAERLAEAICFPTISWEGGKRFDREAFLAFHGFLERSFPRVHAEL